jgi:two-component system sensor histidine kinase DesK
MPNAWNAASAPQPKRSRRAHLHQLSWLLYAAFWFIQPALENQRKQWIELAVTLAIFLPLFIGAHYTRPSRRGWSVLGMLVVAWFYVPMNLSAFGIYIFISSELPDLFELTREVVPMLVLECLIIVFQAWLFHLPNWEWTIAIGMAVLTSMNYLHMRQQQRASAKLLRAQDEITQLAKTAERERIARDLHDLLGHTLSLIVIKSELASKLFEVQPERAQRELRDIEETARRALSEVRETVTGYRSRGLGDELLEAAHTLEAAGVRPEVPSQAPRLHAQDEATFSLVLREAVTNVVRHAAARTCRVEIASTGSATLLTIVDDGRGGIEREGNGLRGMRERILELGGSLTLSSAQGTRIEVALPAR